jgi:sulfatase modifying factor 1
MARHRLLRAALAGAAYIGAGLLLRCGRSGTPADSVPPTGQDGCVGCSDAAVADAGASDAIAPSPVDASCASCDGGWCQLTAGTFKMGAPASEPARAAVAEDPVVVTLTHPFEISQHEVTVAEWMALGLPLSQQPKQPTGCNGPSCPVYATWFDALLYANHKSQAHNPPLAPCYRLTGCAADGGAGTICTGAVETGPLYDCPGYRIPTEAEWEYACRAGTTTAFYEGDFTLRAVPEGGNLAFASYDVPMLDPIAWYATNSDGAAHPVGAKWPNSFCLYDMLGNMAEWTSGGYSGQPYGTSPQVDPSATLGTFTERVERGGQYFGWPAIVDCYNRAGPVVRVPIAGTGVRLVRSL